MNITGLLMFVLIGLTGCAGKWAKMGFKMHLPQSYEAVETQGLIENFTGMYATGPLNPAGTYHAGIAVIVEPDTSNGGQWSGPDEKAEHAIRIMSKFNKARYDNQFKLVTDESAVIDGRTGRRVIMEYNIILDQRDYNNW